MMVARGVGADLERRATVLVSVWTGSDETAVPAAVDSLPPTTAALTVPDR